MSTEIAVIDRPGQEELYVTTFWAGTKRGMMVQITSGINYIQLTRDSLQELMSALKEAELEL